MTLLARRWSWLALAVVFFGSTPLYAAESAAAPPITSAAPITDPDQVAGRYHEVLHRPEFQEVAEPSVNSGIEDWLSQWFKSLGARFGEFKYASRMPAFESLLMTLLVAFALAVLLYIMLRLTRRRGRMYPEMEDQFSSHKTICVPEDYDQEIGHALGQGDWHAAYLAAWRQFLSRLERCNLVDLDRTRTNREYLAQLRARPLHGPALSLLNNLVDGYDRFIYGRQALAETDWKGFRRQIDEAVLLLHLDEKSSAGGRAAP